MDLEKVYHDSEGKERNILQMVKREPEWAANIIQLGERAIARLDKLPQQVDATDMEKVLSDIDRYRGITLII